MNKNSSTISQRYRKRLLNRSIEPSPRTAEGNTCDPPEKKFGSVRKSADRCRHQRGRGGVRVGSLRQRLSDRQIYDAPRTIDDRGVHAILQFFTPKKCLDPTSSADKNGQLFHIPGPLSFPQKYPHYFSLVFCRCVHPAGRKKEAGIES
jgi:hypothetical protein